ncbi:hypothetical protein Airi02_062010 [Actinoallomurus iriomotensis]|uniref:Uncharacterized protein n=1 Tax=Actinoallomurus iriomotensis TaxID=478107 RepID=A0A9W6S9P9_9ACTN|nr:hypothetical protein Airi02_062010 [Actinoallomurus iriomotensis]
MVNVGRPDLMNVARYLGGVRPVVGVPFLIARPTRFSRPAIGLAALWAGAERLSILTTVFIIARIGLLCAYRP